MPVRIVSAGGGGVTLSAASTGSEFTATLPAATGTVVTTGSSAVVTPAMLTQPLTLGTAVASTSGTAIDFTSIPSWARRVTLMLNGVSTNGSTALIVRLGTSGGFEATGYDSSGGFFINTTTSTVDVLTTAFTLEGTTASYTAPAVVRNGLVTFANVSGNIWVASGAIGRSGGPAPATGSCGGAKTLGGVLDRLRLTTANGTDTFDAGSVNIMYEG